MSGKPAARQGDMTQYGGPIVQGSAGVRIGAPTGVACSVCPGGMTSGNPVNPLLGAKVLPGETDLALPGRCRSFSPAPTAATGRRRLHRWGFLAPAGKRLLISAYRYAMMHWYSTTTADGAFTLSRCCRVRRCTAAASPCGWCVAVRQRSRTAIRWHGCGRRCRRISG
ncbi:type IV secretion protein Rhs [Escherichia coli]|nr:type IV secretion protein Rhs [Escherichia coli]